MTMDILYPTDCLHITPVATDDNDDYGAGWVLAENCAVNNPVPTDPGAAARALGAERDYRIIKAVLQPTHRPTIKVLG